MTFSCQKDDTFEDANSKLVTLPVFKSSVGHGGFLISSNKLLQNKIKKFNTSLNEIIAYSNEYGFGIDTTRIRLVETELYNSYTFAVERDTYNSNIIENYVLTSYNDGSIEQYLISYPIIDNNGLIEYDLNNASLNSIYDDGLIFSRGENCESIMKYEEPVCEDVLCQNNGGQQHTVADGDECALWGTPWMATIACNGGGWIEIDGNCGSNGGNGGNNSPGGGSVPDGNETIVIPLEPNYAQLIETCINGLVVMGQTDATTIEAGLINSLNIDTSSLYYLDKLLNTQVCSETAQQEVIDLLFDLFDEEIFVDEGFRNNDCLKSVYDDMGKASTFKGYLQNFEPESPVAHLRFATSSIMPSDVNAETSTPNNYLIKITFNTNNLDRPRLSVARTFIHELIHAEIYRKLLSVAQTSNLQSLTVPVIEQLKNDYFGLYDYYTRWKNDIPTGMSASSAQHQLMAEHYRGIIRQALEDFDDTQSEETYNALSWVGLTGSENFNAVTGLYSDSTIAWTNLSQSQRLSILSTISTFNSTNSNCQE